MIRFRLYICSVIVFLLVLILDAKTAVLGAQEGITLCLQTVIPALFPFFVISSLLTGILTYSRIKGLCFLGRICGMPSGTEHIFLIGLLGGYPAGASLVYQSWENGYISDKSAKRMLAYCNNAGPAFIFGLCGPIFGGVKYSWIMWGIQILSAIFTGFLFRTEPTDRSTRHGNAQSIALPIALDNGLKSIARVCGWVVLFRTGICIIKSWLPSVMPPIIQTLLFGVLELTNGCYEIGTISSPGDRFICTAFLLSSGGLCVLMQTVSITGKLGIGKYIPGKFTQAIFSVFLSVLLQLLLFPESQQAKYSVHILYITGILIFGAIIGTYIYKKTVDFQTKAVYNQNIVYDKRGSTHAFPKKDRKILQLLRIQHPA